MALAATTVLALGIGRLTWARMAKPADSLAAPVFPGAVTNESPKLAVAESSATRREVAEPAPRQIAAQPAPAPARSIDEGKAGRSRPAPESPPTDAAAAAARARSKEADAGAAPAKPLAPAENIHLDELVVTGRTEPVKPDAERRFDSAAAGALAKTVAPVPSMARKARSELADQRALRLEAIGVQVTADDALRTLGGSIKLIDGLLPQRFDLVGSRIRVVYPMSWGPLVLEEWREAGVLQYRLIPPVGMSTDSLAVIATRIK